MYAFFLFFEAKEAVEVIEASDVIMYVEVIEATKVLETISFWVKNIARGSKYKVQLSGKISENQKK